MRKAGETQQAYFEAKAALKKAETEWRKTSNSYMRLARENRTRDAGTEPTEAFRRAERAYNTAGAALSEAREHLRLLQCTLLPPKRRPNRHNAEPDDDEMETPE